MSVLEKYDWQEEGYRPLLLRSQWMVAVLNWEPAAERRNLQEIERHKHTDEVFVLLRGRSVLLLLPEDELVEVQDLELGIVYNVPAGVWHNVISSRDVKFLIVENQDTHLSDTELRPIAPSEIVEIDKLLPAWAKSE